MPAQPPTAPPRRKKNITKSDISEPYDFVHLNHVGLDFNSDDVKRAIRPASSSSPQSSPVENLYESVNRTETPILSGTPPRYDFPPPAEMAPELDKPSTAKIPPPRPPKPEVVEYINRPSQHLYMNVSGEKGRPSRKKNPPPPPPQTEKPRLEVPDDAAPVAFRKPSTPPPEPEQEEAPKIETAHRIDAAPPSVVLERPGMLGEMRIGLDDPIPIIKGMSSKYRTPTMLTPREMAVDVPSTMRTPDEPKATPPPLLLAPSNAPAAPVTHTPNKAPLAKEPAVDVSSPPQPPQPKQESTPREPRDRSAEKRRAPAPPAVLSEPSKTVNNPIYVPLSAARSSPQLKNVITELKVKQGSGEEITEIKEEEEEESHEYVALDGLRRSKVVAEPVASEETKAKQSSEAFTSEAFTSEAVLKPKKQSPVESKSKEPVVESKTTPEAPAKAESALKEEKKSQGSKERSQKEEVSKTAEKRVEQTPEEVKKEQTPTEKTEKQPKRTESKDKADKPPVIPVTVELDVKPAQKPMDSATESAPKSLQKSMDSKPPLQETPPPQPQPNPVPRPRKTVPTVEESTEEKVHEVRDDGIDTGYSDDENEVIRL